MPGGRARRRARASSAAPRRPRPPRPASRLRGILERCCGAAHQSARQQPRPAPSAPVDRAPPPL